MAKNNKLLVSAKSFLDEHFYTIFSDTNALEICLNNNSLPIAFAVVEKDLPEVIILSLSLDFPDPIIASKITLLLNNVTHVELAEEFYYSQKDGSLHFGDEAHNKIASETDNDLKNLQPFNNYLH